MTKPQLLTPYCILFYLLLLSPITVAERSVTPQHDKIPEGITQLSPYFSVELSGGTWFSPLILQTYHHSNGNKKRIGLTKFTEFASRQNGYAISDDGKTLLYFHQNLPSDGGVNKTGGLYEFNHDQGDQRLHGFVSNAVYLPIKLPRHIIVYAQLKKIKNSIRLEQDIILRDTHGNEKPWQP